MKIRHNKTVATSVLLIGGLLFVFSLAMQQWFVVCTGALTITLGFSIMVNPRLSIEPHEVQLRNPIGRILKRFPVTSPADLSLEDNLLVHVPGDEEIIKFGVETNKTDLAQLRAQLAGDPH